MDLLPDHRWQYDEPTAGSVDNAAVAHTTGIAVYVTDVEATAKQLSASACLHLLSAGEQAQYSRLRIEDRRWQYLVSRILVRTVLADYACCSPLGLEFERTFWGRPILRGVKHVQFSLSHCPSHVALAVSDDPLLGIDVESLLPFRRSFSGVAKQHFDAVEWQQLQGYPAEQQFEHFIELWTLKEAYVKALGLGMHKPMAECVFQFSHRGRLCFRDTRPEPTQILPTEFSIWALDDGTRLALACRAPCAIKFYYLRPLTCRAPFYPKQLLSSRD